MEDKEKVINILTPEEENVFLRFTNKDEYWGYWLLCSKCHAIIIDGSNFCNNCGTRVHKIKPMTEEEYEEYWENRW